LHLDNGIKNVNIAARLEGLDESGGICISKTAFDYIENKLPYGYEFLGYRRWTPLSGQPERELSYKSAV